jgi:hypothetical protein
MADGGIISKQEKEDLKQVLTEWLQSNDIHDFSFPEDFDTAEEHLQWIEYYVRVGKLYYLFTGEDFLCGHGFISNYAEGRGSLVKT